MKRVKVGIVGVGRLGRHHAYSLAYTIPNADLIAVCSIVKDELEYAKDNLGAIHTYTDYSQMLENERLEAIVVASSSDKHKDHIVSAIKKGLHVFTEKPLGITVEDCHAVEKVVEANSDKVFMIGFMRRYDVSYQAVKEKIERGEIGKPIVYKGVCSDSVSVIENALKFAPTGGGMFIDYAVHDIDLARWYLGSDIISIYGTGGAYKYKEFSEFNDVDNACTFMRFKNGSIGVIYNSRLAPYYQVGLEIVGTDGIITIDDKAAKNYVSLYKDGGKIVEGEETFQERFRSAYIAELQEFINCICENRQPEITVYDGTEATRAAYAAKMSYLENKVVYL